MSAEVFRFNDFELDKSAYELRNAGRVIRLERIPLELLFLLVERRGQLISREEILDRIWGKDVFFDADNGINTAVRKIRRALKDNPEDPRFLHTVPGKGYRFTVEITSAEPVPAATAAIFPPVAPADRKVVSRQLWIPILGLIIALVSLLAYRAYQIDTESSKIMLAVLPFANLNGDVKQEFLADGMTEELIAQLGSLDPRHLGVIARTSAMQYKNAHEDIAQIAHDLNVKYLLEGSVRREGQQVRVTAQLIQARDQTHLWAQSYDRDLSSVLQLQSDIARAVAEGIRITLSEDVRLRLATAVRVNPEAYEASLEGLHDWNLRTEQGCDRAIADFTRAVTIDPSYGLAYSELARSYSLAPICGGLSPSEAMPKALQAAQKALAIDSTLPEAHIAIAFVKAHYEYDWPGAKREFQRALELNPSYSYAHFFYSNSYLSPLGRHEEAVAEMTKAIQLDPLSQPIQSFFGWTYAWARRNNDAINQYRRSVQLNPNFPLDHERLAHLYAHLGNYTEAINEESKARVLSGEDPEQALAHAHAMTEALELTGAMGYWRKQLEFAGEKENPPEAYVSPFGRAIIYAELEDRQRCFASLEQGYAERDLHLIEAGVEPAFDSLHSDPQFQQLLRRIGVSR